MVDLSGVVIYSQSDEYDDEFDPFVEIPLVNDLEGSLASDSNVSGVDFNGQIVDYDIIVILLLSIIVGAIIGKGFFK